MTPITRSAWMVTFRTSHSLDPRVRVQADAPATLSEVLGNADADKRRAVLRNMSIELIPIMEKGIVDPVLSHR